MLKDKLIAIPSIPNLVTKINENTRSIIKVKMEITVFIFIIPTADSKLPYKFRNNILIEKPANKMVKTQVLSAYLSLKNNDKISVLNKNPKTPAAATKASPAVEFIK